MKVYFDKKGHIKEVIYDTVTATSHNDVKIEAYADFDVSPYIVSIAFKRPDGFTLGSYSMNPVVENNEVHHEYSLTKNDTEISGEMQATIRYEIYQLTEDGELELTYSKPAGMITFVIYEAVVGEDNRLVLIDSRLDKLESKLKEIELTGGYKEIEISRTEPEDKTKDRLWFKIL